MLLGVSIIAERKCQVSALIDSTPHLLESAVVKGFVSEFEKNAGVIHLLYQFLQLLSLYFDYKW